MPFGTKIIIPSLTGTVVWTCRDRMNSRFSGNYIDLLIDYRLKGIGIQKHKVYLIGEWKK